MTKANAAVLRENASIEELVQKAGFTIDGRGHTLTTKEHESLTLYTGTNSWYWFSKGVGGSTIDWIMFYYNVGFSEALDILEGYTSLQASEAAALPSARDDFSGIHVPEPVPPPPDLRQDLHLVYHRRLDPAARQWWHDQGIDDEAISRFFLGVCDDHPQYGRAYTIPVIERGKLVNLRMRLHEPPKPKDKYRPWASGYGTQLFNSDILTPELGSVIVTAGEKKVIVLWSNGLSAVSPTGGCTNWRDEWTTRLQFCHKVYIAFDPNETAAAWKLASKIGERAFVVNLPDKPDDFLMTNGPDEFRKYIETAEPVVDYDYWERQLGGNRLWGKML